MRSLIWDRFESPRITVDSISHGSTQGDPRFLLSYLVFRVARRSSGTVSRPDLDREEEGEGVVTSQSLLCGSGWLVGEVTGISVPVTFSVASCASLGVDHWLGDRLLAAADLEVEEQGAGGLFPFEWLSAQTLVFSPNRCVRTCCRQCSSIFCQLRSLDATVPVRLSHSIC